MDGLSRRQLLALATAYALIPRLRADDLPGFYYRDYSKCFRTIFPRWHGPPMKNVTANFHD